MSKFEKLKKQHKNNSEVKKQRLDLADRGMTEMISDSKRVLELYQNAGATLDDIDKRFEKETNLYNKTDISFLFLAAALQIVRWLILNRIFEVSNAGTGNKIEDDLHGLQNKILNKYDKEGISEEDKLYYCSLKHIISKDGVPFDATGYLNDKAIEKLRRKGKDWNTDLQKLILKDNPKIFKGANHRFATVGHDPIFGLVFGTANIMTNTITTVADVEGFSPNTIRSNHVVYTTEYSDPRIGSTAFTSIILYASGRRAKEEPKALTASLIKQIIHIGTDLYTPMGIQIPGANLILTKENVEKLTHYINTGDAIKAAGSGLIAIMINAVISAFHSILFDPEVESSRELHSVRTRRIIDISNSIALAANIAYVGVDTYKNGGIVDLRKLDVGGMIVTIHRLVTDASFIKEVKETYLENEWIKTVTGNEYKFISEVSKNE